MNPLCGALAEVRLHNGDKLLYHPESNTFVSLTKDV
ncbi:hypothetical protein BMS_3093 [Halobacteriovorax marinus SJ]|uniref:Uncharacterized protein n=1 Tax=Halobacteriovorax marinus (strain ATCC BAA-682 / DSM 15412 / SJ) TaxID=862908 RepID=E1WZG2_HALMS|nr:hypothetical protein BMS_3093 [Halobacteriovorax marinus SJ]